MANSIVNGGKIARSVSTGHSGSGIALPSQFGSQLASLQGQGSRLYGDLKSQMESGFGRDFSDVRIHTDSVAAEMSDNISAKAFTYGNDIFFNRGQFNPETSEGQNLVAHELTHVVQETGKVGRQGGGNSNNQQLTQVSEAKTKALEISNDVVNQLGQVVYPTNLFATPSPLSRRIFNCCRYYMKSEKYKQINDMVSVLLNALTSDGEIIGNVINQIDIKSDSVPTNAICQAYILNMNEEPELFNNSEYRTIKCNSDKWNPLSLEEKAFTIIHEFSHMWIKANDFCYFDSRVESEECRDLSEDLSSVQASENSNEKTPVASAIENYVRAIYLRESPGGSSQINIGSESKTQLTDVKGF